MTPDNPDTIVVELRPYQERRRTRSFAAGLLLGLWIAAILIPTITEIIDFLEELGDVDLAAPGPDDE